jgi:nitrite reductase/ring-hydroxylating ferredoxin subunit
MAEFVEAARLDQIPQGTGATVTLASRDLALFNVQDVVYARDDGCFTPQNRFS